MSILFLLKIKSHFSVTPWTSKIDMRNQTESKYPQVCQKLKMAEKHKMTEKPKMIEKPKMAEKPKRSKCLN